MVHRGHNHAVDVLDSSTSAVYDVHHRGCTNGWVITRAFATLCVVRNSIVSGKCEWIQGTNGKIAILWIYVDDCGLTGNWKDEIYNMEKHLLEKFPGKV